MPRADWNGPYCAEPWTTVFVTWDGQVRTCCVGEQSFGSLAEKSIAEIWSGPEWQQFREAIARDEVPENCVGCLKNQRNNNQFSSVEAVLRSTSADAAASRLARHSAR